MTSDLAPAIVKSCKFSKRPFKRLLVAVCEACMVELTLPKASPKRLEKDLASLSEGAEIEGKLVEIEPTEPTLEGALREFI